MLYLRQPHRPPALLADCFEVARECGAQSVSFAFSDRLPHVQERDIRLAKEKLVAAESRPSAEEPPVPLLPWALLPEDENDEAQDAWWTREQ